MQTKSPKETEKIIQLLLRGYQFSGSDRYRQGYDTWYGILDREFDWFRTHLSLDGFVLMREKDVIFLEKGTKSLSQEEKQTVVVLFLLADLWLEKGKSYADLYQINIPWSDLDWFRDGYGREYLSQVGIERGNEVALESLFKRLANKGFLEYNPDTQTLTLRNPSERLINMARHLHQHINADESIESTEGNSDGEIHQ